MRLGYLNVTNTRLSLTTTFATDTDAFTTMIQSSSTTTADTYLTHSSSSSTVFLF